MRCLHFALALLAAPLLVAPLRAQSSAPPNSLYAQTSAPPNFSGTWQVDAAKSPDAGGRSVTFTIQDASGKIDFTRVAQEKDGKEMTSHFSCAVGGNQCDFDEGGHKAKVSLWYNGPSLNILKTDGPKEDSTTEWKLDLSPDHKTLTVEFTHVEPSDKSETLVFNKK